MKAASHFSVPVMALGAVAAVVAMSSCSMPPREAWREIQQDGLIPFLARQNGTTVPYVKPMPATPTPKVVTPAEKSALASASRDYAGPPKPAPVTAATAPSTPAPAPAPAPAPTAAPEPKPMPVAPAKALSAINVPSLPGFVRSPYTSPPRLVDVKGAKPGASMICPYTQRAFVVPSDFVSQAPTPIASTPPAPSKPAPSIAARSMPVPITRNAPAKTVAASTTANPLPPPPATSPAASLFSDNGGGKSAANTPAPSKADAPETPYGLPIPGRPGFVNSPFALKHQLVDVTGLPTGMEVKCPYTGKLFKVPAQDIAAQRSVAAPGALTAPQKSSRK